MHLQSRCKKPHDKIKWRVWGKEVTAIKEAEIKEG